MNSWVSMSDAEFLDASDLNYLLENFYAEFMETKGEDINDFGLRYFARVLSCQHVVGASFEFITSCNYNRRAFVVCVIEMFSSFPAHVEFTQHEFYQLLRVLCPDLSIAVLEQSLIGQKKDKKYPNRLMQTEFYLYMLYEEWLNELSAFIVSEGSVGCIRASFLRVQVDGWRTCLPIHILQPPPAAIETVFKVHAAAAGSPTLTISTMSPKDISYDFFRTELVNCSAMVDELFRRTTNKVFGSGGSEAPSAAVSTAPTAPTSPRGVKQV